MTIYLLGMIPCLAVAGIGATGRCKCYATGPGTSTPSCSATSKDAVKGNWKYGLLVGLINGLFPVSGVHLLHVLRPHVQGELVSG